MILAFLAGALVFLFGVLTGATLVSTNTDRILNHKDI